MFNNKRDAQYRREGLSMMQASRLEDRGPDGSAKLLIAGLAVIATGCLAFLATQQLGTRGPAIATYSAAPPSGTAMQVMMALKVPHDREREAARLALLENNPSMEVQSLDTVERLVAPNVLPAPVQAEPEPAADPVEQPPLVAEAAPEPAPTVLQPEPQTTPLQLVATEIDAPEDDPAPEVVEVAAVDLPPAPITDIEALRAAVSPELLLQAGLVDSCFTELQEAARSATIYFPVGSAQLTGQDLATISRIGRMAQDCRSARVQVTGHSDQSGTDLANLNLSWQRADNTVTAMGEMGIDTSRFEPVGFGARTPLAQGDASDEDRNRRVEFVIIKDLERN